MLFASIVETILPKTKRLKLIEVVHLLKEITAIEMDLRFEGSAGSELKKNTKNPIQNLKCLILIGILHQKEF